MNIVIKNPSGIHEELAWLPCKEEQLENICTKLNMKNTATTQCHIKEVYNDELADDLLKDKTYNLDKLNYLTKRLDSFDANEMVTFYAVAYSEKMENIDELINLTFNIYGYSVVSDFSDLNAIGKRMYLTEQIGASVEELDELNGKGYFEKVLADNPMSTVTPYGIVYRNKNEYEQVYDGIHLPQYNWEENMGNVNLSYKKENEYLYLPYEPTELTKALQRLGAKDIAECKIELENSVFTDKMVAIIDNVKMPSIEKMNTLNHFAKKIEKIGTEEKPYFDKLIGYLNPQTEKDLNSLLDSAYEFEIFDNIHSAEDYGRYMICESGHFEYDENLEDFIDFEGYGRHRLNIENGAFTDNGYIIYHGYNMELSEMFEEIGIEIAPQKPQLLKLYMPLKATTYYDQNRYGDLYRTDFEIDVYPEELVEYEDEILAAIENNKLPEEKERGLMKYYGDVDSVSAKVKRYDFSVENVDGKLMGVATLELNASLDDNEMARIKNEIEGQSLDGWGENFNQREINCNGKDVLVSFWSSENWSLKTAEELGIEEPKQELIIGGM